MLQTLACLASAVVQQLSLQPSCRPRFFNSPRCRLTTASNGCSQGVATQILHRFGNPSVASATKTSVWLDWWIRNPVPTEWVCLCYYWWLDLYIRNGYICNKIYNVIYTSMHQQYQVCPNCSRPTKYTIFWKQLFHGFRNPRCSSFWIVHHGSGNIQIGLVVIQHG